MTAIRQAAVTWSIGVLATFAILILMACLEHQHSETDALQRTADVVNDRAAEYAAINNASVAKE